MTTAELLQYSPERFVNREDEIKLLEERVEELTKSTGRHGAIAFIGERGVGKTWLPSHLSHQLQQKKVFLVWLDLKKYSGKDPGWAVADIIRHVSAETEGRRERLGADLAEMSRTLFQHLQNVLQKQPLVVIVDHVYEADWKLLPVLEDYLLGPLAVEPRVLIVLAGRGRLYPWKTPELTLRSEQVTLRPFKEDETKKQLQRQVPGAVDKAKAKEIHDLTGGNPLSNYLLAVGDLDQTLEVLLNSVPEDRRPQVRGYLEALCVLRVFDEERIPAMLAAYYGDESYKEWSYAEARRVREELVRWALAHWDGEKRGYVIDRIVRTMLETYLEKEKPEKWENLHRAALALYSQWEKDYPSTEDRWRQEVKYHTERLEESS